jgi:hypothetical protein
MTPEQLMATMGEKGWTTHRTLDPVRAAALHEAVQLVSSYGDMDGARFEDQAIKIAERFEAWLAGPETE